MTDTITIQSLLRGCEAGQIQTASLMSMIPLTSNIIYNRFGLVSTLQVQTEYYGSLKIYNPLDEIGIVPLNSTFITKERAQDHAILRVLPINSRSEVIDNTAACIQSNQGGLLSPGKHDLSFLPWSIREDAFSKKDIKEYSKLWDDIGRFNSSLGLNSVGHLDLYLERYKQELDQFIAEFEIIPYQVGAIILINGKVVGIEKAPNYAYWKDIWRPLIREGYGSLVLQLFKNKKDFIPKLRVPLNCKNASTLDDIKQALIHAQNEEARLIKQTVKDFVQEDFDTTQETIKGNLPNLSVESLSNPQFFGQAVRDGEAVIYLSLSTKRLWSKNEEWYKAKEFSI